MYKKISKKILLKVQINSFMVATPPSPSRICQLRIPKKQVFVIGKLKRAVSRQGFSKL